MFRISHRLSYLSCCSATDQTIEYSPICPREQTAEKLRNATSEVDKWVNNQKINPEDLLFKIAGKDINVPTNLSLHLVLDSLIEKGAELNTKGEFDKHLFIRL